MLDSCRIKSELLQLRGMLSCSCPKVLLKNFISFRAIAIIFMGSICR